MKKLTALLTTGLLSASILSPVYADGHKKDKEEEYENHQGHAMSQHHVKMMQMLSETMSILRDLNHKPSDAEKARLSDMIMQLDDMAKNGNQHSDKGMPHMEKHKEMKEKGMKNMEKHKEMKE
jgi:hypothetical protein